MNLRRRIVLLTLLAGLAAAMGGCAFFSWLVNVMAPPKGVSAEYKLAAGEKVLVFVDDLGKPVRYEQIKRMLTEKINRLLLENKAVGEVVPYEDIFRMAAGRPDFNRLGIANIARELGAGQAVYVLLKEFKLKDDPQFSLWHGKLKVAVLVVDLKGKVLWPLDSPKGHQPKTVVTTEVDNPSSAYGTKVATELADKMALNVARLFYKHSVPRGHLSGEE